MLDEIELNLYSPKPDLRAEDVLGKPACVTASLHEGPERHLGGIVMRFGMGAPQAGCTATRPACGPGCGS